MQSVLPLRDVVAQGLNELSNSCTILSCPLEFFSFTNSLKVYLGFSVLFSPFYHDTRELNFMQHFISYRADHSVSSLLLA